MLEDCHDLPASENRLSQEIRKIELLGDVDLSSGDVDHLASLIRQAMSTTAGKRSLTRQARACLSCFLVWKGITGYCEGDYWSAVWQSIGLAHDPNRERSWGQAFLDFLEANDLPRFEIWHGHTYVTPILIHGGIPNSCLDDFFEKVLLPIARQLYDATDPEEVAYELDFFRQDNGHRERIQQQFGDLRKQIRDLNQRIRHARLLAQTHDEIARLWELESPLDCLEATAAVPDDFEAFREGRLKEIDCLKAQITELEKEQGRCTKVIARFSGKDRAILAQSVAIETASSQSDALKEKQNKLDALEAEERGLTRQLGAQSARVLSRPWEEQYSTALCRLPLDKLEAEITRFRTLAVRENQQQRALADLKASPDSSLRVQLIVGVVSLIVGLASVSVGIRLGAVWPWIAAGTCYTLAAGAPILSWHQRQVRERTERQALGRALAKTAREQQRIRDSISEILSGLPLSGHLLETPSSRLVQVLGGLARTHQRSRETRVCVTQLHQDIACVVRRVESVAATVGIKPGDTVDDTIRSLQQRLQDARDHQAAAACAEEELQSQILPETEQLKGTLSSLREELSIVKDQVADLGGGDVDTGLDRLKTLRQKRDKARTLRKDLEGRYAGLAGLEREIRNARELGWSKSFFEAESGSLKRQVEGKRTEKDSLEHELAYYPPVFPGVDEPIRRYLFHAQRHAEGFLVGCLSMLHEVLATGHDLEVEYRGVPERVVDAFDRWWSQHVQEIAKPEEEADAVTGQRFRAPSVFLDPGMAEIMVQFHAQRYLASIGGTSPRLEVAGSLSDARSRTFPLRVYAGGEGLLETQELEFPLPFPANQYEFDLKSDGIGIHRWEVIGGRGVTSRMAFDHRSDRLIKDGHLPGTKLWLVSKCVSVAPADCVLEEGSLWGEWRDYNLRLVYLDQVDELCLVDDQGEPHCIPVAKDRPGEPALVDAWPLQGVVSEGIEVYAGSPPRVRVPLEDAAELRLWRISVLPEKETSLRERKHHRLSDLYDVMDVRVDQGWTALPLTIEELLGPRPTGRFTICLRKPPHTNWRSTFCILQSLEIGFDEEVYLPREEGEAPDICARILPAPGMEFLPQPPTRLNERVGNLFTVGVKGGEDYLRGMICPGRSDEKGHGIPLTIYVPKLTWRLQGGGDDRFIVWCDSVEELWLGDWEATSELYLVVRLPSFVDGQVKLRLEGSSTEQNRVLRDGKARFDLLRFGDELRSGPSVRTFTLGLPDRQLKTEETPLFRVRTRWEVEEVECVQRSERRAIILSITWTEKGRTDGKVRVLRLWKTTDTMSRALIEKELLEDARVTLRANAKDLPAGEYTLQFALEDPWATSTPLPPEQGAPNTHVLKIVHVGDVWQGKILTLRCVRRHGVGFALPERAYRIEIVGKIIYGKLPSAVSARGVLVTRTNEGWYVGRIQVADPVLNAEISRTNPVKLEYDASSDRITAIEDSDGEGAMFCRECWKLYWSQEANLKEERQGHHVVGPIEEFDISWES